MCKCEMFATNHEPMACRENKTLNFEKKSFHIYMCKIPI